MTERSCHDGTAAFVERMGLLWETEGLPRIAGRIFGYLLVQPEPRSLDEMACALAVSKASISTDARRLEQLRLIERTARSGDRRDYYEIAADAPAQMLALRLERMRHFENAFDGLLQRADLHPVADERLARFERSHHRVLHTLTTLLDDLRAEGGALEHVLTTRTGTL